MKTKWEFLIFQRKNEKREEGQAKKENDPSFFISCSFCNEGRRAEEKIYFLSPLLLSKKEKVGEI